MSDQYLFLTRPHCPRCYGLDLRTLRSVRDQGDGSIMRRTLCLGCGHRFAIILDPPTIPPPRIGRQSD